uniref:Uncharacterized protein n=1 Tax=Arundo donax TaxID=35708 RepID=A0A0A8YU30_ARUDO
MVLIEQRESCNVIHNNDGVLVCWTSSDNGSI